MRFPPHRLREKLERLIVVGVGALVEYSRRICGSAPYSAECEALSDAVAAVVALDAGTAKPPAAGCGYGRSGLTRVELALAAGPAARAAHCTCSLVRAGVEPGIAALLAPLHVLAEPRSWGEHGYILASSLVTAALVAFGDALRVSRVVGEADVLGSVLFYAAHLLRPPPSWAGRIAYQGLPDITSPTSPLELLAGKVPLRRVLLAASESSILWRDVIEGLPRASSLSTLPPDAAIVEAVRLYAGESGIARRRGARAGWDPRDAWLASLTGFSPGDAVDLGLLAALLSLLERLYPPLLHRQRYTVEGVD